MAESPTDALAALRARLANGQETMFVADALALAAKLVEERDRQEMRLEAAKELLRLVWVATGTPEPSDASHVVSRVEVLRQENARLDAENRRLREQQQNHEAAIRVAMKAGAAVERAGTELKTIDREGWKRSLDAAQEAVVRELIEENEKLRAETAGLREAIAEASLRIQEAGRHLECSVHESEEVQGFLEFVREPLKPFASESSDGGKA